jgi:hypothetical protein
VSWLLAAIVAVAAFRVGVADGDAGPEEPVDVAAKLTGLFSAGQYRQALAESEPLEKELKPRGGRDPQLIPRTKLWVDLMAFRGSIERRMGDFEAAKAKYEAGFRELNDKDLRRAISGVLRGGDKAAGLLVPLELTNLEILDGRADLLVDALTNLEVGEAGGEEAVSKAVTAARKAADLARTAREGLGQRLGKADAALRQSPHSLMVASMTRPLRAAGRLALAEARLAADTVKPAADEKAADEKAADEKAADEKAADEKAADEKAADEKVEATPQQALASFEEAIVVAEAAMAPALPKPLKGTAVVSVPPPAPATATPADLSIAIREAGLVRADLLEWRAQARRAGGDLASARSDLAAAIAWRKAAQGAGHPDLVEPLTSAAEALLSEARIAVEALDVAASISRFEAAAVALEEAEKILAEHREQFVETSPLPERIAGLRDVVAKERQAVSGVAGNVNAVDAAAARVLRLLDALPVDDNVQPEPR